MVSLMRRIFGSIVFLPAILIVLIPWLEHPFKLPASRYGMNIRAGEVVFRENCGRCHSTGTNQSSGPALGAIGRDASSRKPDMSAAQYILESMIDPQAYRKQGVTELMPYAAVDLTDEQIRNIVAFLASLGAEPEFKEIARLEITRKPKDPFNDHWVADRRRIETGRGVFLKNCATCHYRGSLLAPSMERIGLFAEDMIRQSITEPSRYVVAGYEPSTIVTKTGRQHVGHIVAEDETDIVMWEIDAKGITNTVKIPIDDVEERNQQSISTMPSYARTLSESELDYLVEFLKCLR